MTESHDWMLENLEKFRSFVGPRVKTLLTAEEISEVSQIREVFVGFQKHLFEKEA